MKYALNLAKDGRILSAIYSQFSYDDCVLVDKLPDGDIADYVYVNNQYVYEPIPKQEQYNNIETPSKLDIIEAQVTYTAMMTDTLLGV